MTHKNSIGVDERGIALVLSLFLMLVVSVLSASLMFLSQTETYSSANYRLMSQSRYGAEAGAQKATNYLLYTYAVPGGAGDPLASYDTTVSPVTYLGRPVVLSAMAGVASNYPAAATVVAFNAAAQGSLASGITNVQYSAYAQLISMRQFTMYGGATGLVQTWRITADGTVQGGRTATEEVSTTLEQQVVPAAPYTAFGTESTCGSLTFAGNELIDSYDSASMTMAAGSPVTQASGGSVGTNGNLTLSGSATIDGKLYTPRTGVGSCSAGAVDALTLHGTATVAEGLVQLPQPVSLPLPLAPSPTPPTTGLSFTKTSGCGATPSCSSSGANITLVGGTPASPLTLGDVDVSTKGILHLTAGYYNFNSIKVGSNSEIVIDSGPVVVNIAGQGSTTPIDFSSGSVTNGSFDPSQFQVLYAGTGNIKLTGGASTSMVIYAPAAQANFPSSNATFYGSIIAADVSANGAQIHYDRHLSSVFWTAGSHMLSTFTWKNLTTEASSTLSAPRPR